MFCQPVVAVYTSPGRVRRFCASGKGGDISEVLARCCRRKTSLAGEVLSSSFDAKEVNNVLINYAFLVMLGALVN